MISLDLIFVGCAALGGVLFLVQLIIQFLGHDTSLDVGAHDPSLLAHDGGHSDSSFKLLSFQGLAAVWVIGKLFAAMRRLQSSGTMDLHNAVGQPGEIYLTIPAGGTGKVQVTVQNRLSIFDAVAGNGAELKTGAAVKVTGLRGASIMVVEKI